MKLTVKMTCPHCRGKVVKQQHPLLGTVGMCRDCDALVWSLPLKDSK